VPRKQWSALLSVAVQQTFAALLQHLPVAVEIHDGIECRFEECVQLEKKAF